MLINFRKKWLQWHYSFCVDKEEMHKYMQYEVYDCLYGQDNKGKLAAI